MQIINIGEQQYQVEPVKEKPQTGTVNGESYDLDLAKDGDGFHILRNSKSYRVDVVKADYAAKTFTIRVNDSMYELSAKDRFDLLLEELGMADLASSKANDLKAPMPGMVLDIIVSAGDTVTKGDKLVVLEAMKMENVLKAEGDAVVKAIHAEKGKAVEKNQILVEFES
ncbi:acetyl/propionyl-CoA carboxylase, alpha subunit [Owenweeksia hongkongensis DSM 17368]|uniref:Acetyl/propionyl-CoA carboxylase, alpha subunit n=1 Tax=Owenweeksia hongkongensis (strain DSM 17368 / CIP 108786 / JCM 12287 / NRRL B-23963 / UST20020801) TaxID=926562 RepID=G8R703_OWEHD|nr:acetyl-CoA carboxylase biotin carboxyl carrier protein subunit [Owenweeksia hongkongensis]AEV33368.1 acetyl/propionyl-CoA carboxylase, alpha subunit [Owenweeksia hongkongensis DSM 17368]